jgi:hypothetical protein
MLVAWFSIPYKTEILEGPIKAKRTPEIFKYVSAIRNAGGDCRVVEVKGDKCIAKVRSDQQTIDDLAKEFYRYPKSEMKDILSITSDEETRLRLEIASKGYSTEDISDKLGSDLTQKTLGDILRFEASERIPPRWDEEKQEIVFDKPAIKIDGELDRLDKIV